MKKLIVMLSVCFLAFGFTMGCSDDDDDSGKSLVKKYCNLAKDCSDSDYDACIENNNKAWDNAGSCKSKLESYVKCAVKLSCDEFNDTNECDNKFYAYRECYDAQSSEGSNEGSGEDEGEDEE